MPALRTVSSCTSVTVASITALIAIEAALEEGSAEATATAAGAVPGRSLGRRLLTTAVCRRITLPAACSGLSKVCLDAALKWAGEREQWGAPIGRHGAMAV